MYRAEFSEDVLAYLELEAERAERIKESFRLKYNSALAERSINAENAYNEFLASCVHYRTTAQALIMLKAMNQLFILLPESVQMDFDKISTSAICHSVVIAYNNRSGRVEQ